MICHCSDGGTPRPVAASTVYTLNPFYAGVLHWYDFEPFLSFKGGEFRCSELRAL